MNTCKVPGTTRAGTTLVGRTIADRYELSEPLARGGMGMVYGGRDRVLCRPVAVKAIPLAEASNDSSPGAVEQWWWEARVMAAMRHPHVVQIYDAIQDRGYGYVVMELVDGDDLRQYLARTGPLPYAEALSIGIQVCQALYALHRRGFIHCDVKPHNLLREPHGCVKLTDFGIAQALGSSRVGLRAPARTPAGASYESSGVLFGTATYCSPEQALCDPLTGATDVYSLGVVLYELLTGVPPFVAENPMAVLLQHTDATVPALHHRRSDIPAEVEQAILRALAKTPEQRFASAHAMREALESALIAVVDAAPLTPAPSPAAPPVAAPSPDARRRSVRSARSNSLTQQSTAITYRSAGPQALRARRCRRPPTAAARGTRGRDGESRERTTRVLAATRRSRGMHVQRTPEVSVVLLCLANAVGMLLLIVLLSRVH